MNDLAERAVACAGWRWMPGMRDVVSGERFIAHMRSTALGDYELWSDISGDGGVQPDNPLPDLTDPATLGCLLALVRAKYPSGGRQDCVMTTWYDRELEGWTIGTRSIGPYPDYALWHDRVFATEAEALVAALEAVS